MDVKLYVFLALALPHSLSGTKLSTKLSFLIFGFSYLEHSHPGTELKLEVKEDSFVVSCVQWL